LIPPPRPFVEYQVFTPTDDPIFLTLSVTIPTDVCNDYVIEGEFLPIGADHAQPHFPSFYGDVGIAQTRIPCPPGPVIMRTLIKTFRFEPDGDEDDFIVFVVPGEFQIVVVNDFDDRI
jgi:hypothetical protein